MLKHEKYRPLIFSDTGRPEAIPIIRHGPPPAGSRHHAPLNPGARDGGMGHRATMAGSIDATVAGLHGLDPAMIAADPAMIPTLMQTPVQLMMGAGFGTGLPAEQDGELDAHAGGGEGEGIGGEEAGGSKEDGRVQMNEITDELGGEPSSVEARGA